MACACWWCGRLLRPGLPQIRTLDDWEARKHEVDLDAFRLLLDPAEEDYLRAFASSDPNSELSRDSRLRLALGSLELVGRNAAMLMKLGQLAKAWSKSEVGPGGRRTDIRHASASCKLVLVQPCLWLKWLFPGWRLSIPALAFPYEELLGYLNRIRQERQLDLDRALMAG